VADDDATGIEELACISRAGGGEEIARPFGADPVVAFGVARDLVALVGKIGELVYDEIWAEGFDRVEKEVVPGMPMHCLDQLRDRGTPAW
jgi:hypothetical protein